MRRDTYTPKLCRFSSHKSPYVLHFFTCESASERVNLLSVTPMYTCRVTSLSKPSSSLRGISSAVNRTLFHGNQYKCLSSSIKKCRRSRKFRIYSTATQPSSSPNDDKNDESKAESEERKAKFWNIFLTDAIEISGSGVPKVKRYKTEENKTPNSIKNEEGKAKIEVQGDGFLQRLTLVGLILSACFLISAVQATHFATVKWCLMNPVTLFQNSEVSREVVRRLIAPGVRYIAAYFFARWRVRWALGFAVLSFIAPTVEFD